MSSQLNAYMIKSRQQEIAADFARAGARREAKAERTTARRPLTAVLPRLRAGAVLSAVRPAAWRA